MAVLKQRLSIIGGHFFFFCLAYSATKQMDVPYVAGGGNKQHLDLYLQDSKGFSTILFVHGGGLTSGDRKEAPYPQIAEAFQKTGLGCAVMSYRLGTENKWPAQPNDVAAAFAWLKRNIARRGGDTAKIFLVGHSSGAFLVALVSTDEKYLREFGLSLKDVAGTVVMGAMLNPSYDAEGIPDERLKKAFEREGSYESIFGSPSVYKDADPSRHISARLPPFLVLVAEKERYQPPILKQANEFASKAKRMGVLVGVEVLQSRTHISTIDKMVTSDDPTLQRILRFVISIKK